MALTATGLFLLSRIDFETTVFHVVVVLLLLGFGYALFSSPNMNAIMSSVDRRRSGVASGATASMRLLGRMFSIGVATVLFALYIGRVEIRPETYPILIMRLNIAFTLVRRPMRHRYRCFTGKRQSRRKVEPEVKS